MLKFALGYLLISPQFDLQRDEYLYLNQGLAGACYLGTAFNQLNLLFQPNAFEVFGFALGLALGLGLPNKYTTLFFIAADLAGGLPAPAARGRAAAQQLQCPGSLQRFAM